MNTSSPNSQVTNVDHARCHSLRSRRSVTTGGAEEPIAVARSTAFNPQGVYEMAGFEWEDIRREALICDGEPSTHMS